MSFRGLHFKFHRHGKGPFHYSSEQNGFVFEIYPLTKSMERADNSTRIGLEIENLEMRMERLVKSNWVIKPGLTETE